MKPGRTITFTTYATRQASHKEARERFVIDTFPIEGLRQPVLAPTASLLLLDDESVKRGVECPICFVEQGLTGTCGGCE